MVWVFERSLGLSLRRQVVDAHRTGGERLTDRNRGGRWSRTGTRGLPLGSDVPSPASAALVSLLAASCMHTEDLNTHSSYGCAKRNYDFSYYSFFSFTLCLFCLIINRILLYINAH